MTRDARSAVFEATPFRREQAIELCVVRELARLDEARIVLLRRAFEVGV